MRGRLQVVFLPDYNVSLAEVIIPAADLSEQISTAGKEASGTGNMKLSLNGALTIGTWDGANIEIAEAVGLENFFVCGHRAEDIERMSRDKSYHPADWLARDETLRGVVNALWRGDFNLGEPGLFDELARTITDAGDTYFLCADFRSYAEAQQRVSALYADPRAWAAKALLNVARIGYFSSDRAIEEYARELWHLHPVAAGLPAPASASNPSPRGREKRSGKPLRTRRESD